MGGKISRQKINTDSILNFVFAIGIMISPDTLAMLGSFIGKMGNIGFFLIIFSGLIYLVLYSKYRQSPVFLYWFPNFGFAFILLCVLLGLQLLAVNTALYAQIIFCTIAISGLIILIVSGIIQADQFIFLKSEIYGNLTNDPGLKLFFLPLLLKKPARRYQSAHLFKRIISVISLLILGISILILILMDDKSILILKFLGVSLFICVLPAFLYILKEDKNFKRLE